MQVWRIRAAVLGVALLAMIGPAGPAAAQGVQLGPFRLLPTLGVSLEYDDNILLTPDDELAHTTLSRVLQAAGKVPEAEAAGAKSRVLSWKRQLAETKGD